MSYKSVQLSYYSRNGGSASTAVQQIISQVNSDNGTELQWQILSHEKHGEIHATYWVDEENTKSTDTK